MTDGLLREVLRDNMAKAGLAILVFLIAASIYALIVLPPDFPSQWNDPKHWATHPQLVPPSWVGVFGYPVVPQFDKRMTSDQADYGAALVAAFQNFTVEYRLSVDAFPDQQPGVLVIIEDYRGFNVTFRGRSVEAVAYASVVVERPDGEIVVIADGVPVFNGTDIEVDAALIARQLADLWAKDYGVNVSVSDLQQMPVQALFGRPEGDRIVPLKGEYRLTISISYTARGVPPKKVLDTLLLEDVGVRRLRVVIAGNAYGLMGTDSIGHDLWMGLLYGFPVAMLVGVFTASVAVAIGLFIGVISGYYGGWVDEAIQRLVDVMANIPLLPILVLVGYIVQDIFQNPWERLFAILSVIIVFSWGGLAIIVRSMTLSLKAEPYVETAKAIGASNRRIILRYILPQIIPYALASLVFSVPAAILTEAGLSVLGIEHGLPTWGRILADARAEMKLWAWWWIFPPGILLAVTSLAFVLLGIALEAVVEPRLRRR